MSDPHIECVVWCEHCEVDKFRVVRRETGRNGVFEHVTQTLGVATKNRKTCDDCGNQLSRKEGPSHG